MASTTPMNLHAPVALHALKGKNILITGAASGLGKAMVTLWAKAGANIVIADLNHEAAKKVVDELKKSSGNKNHLALHVDVSSFPSQLSMFQDAMQFVPGNHLDIVAANAGIGEIGAGKLFVSDGAKEPQPFIPKTLDVDINGLIITAHLAYWAFSQPRTSESPSPRHHQLLLIGSVASLTPTPDTPLYGAAKHAVLGLFRALRAKSLFSPFDRNVIQGSSGSSKSPGRVNVQLLCPYFTDTPILLGEDGERVLPQSVELTKIEDVVEAATRLITNEEGGHALVVTTERWAKGRGKGGIWEMREVRSRL